MVVGVLDFLYIFFEVRKSRTRVHTYNFAAADKLYAAVKRCGPVPVSTGMFKVLRETARAKKSQGCCEAYFQGRVTWEGGDS